MHRGRGRGGARVSFLFLAHTLEVRARRVTEIGLGSQEGGREGSGRIFLKNLLHLPVKNLRGRRSVACERVGSGGVRGVVASASMVQSSTFAFAGSVVALVVLPACGS